MNSKRSAKLRNQTIGYLAILLILCLVFSCKEKSGKSADNQLSQAEIEAKFSNAIRIYRMFCSSCHGAEIEAYVDREWKHGRTRENLKMRITEGDLKDGMPAFGSAFSEEEINELVDYIMYYIENKSMYEFEERPDVTGVFESEELNFKLEPVAEGLEYPWGMVFLPDGDMLITDRNGKMYRRTAGKMMVEIENVPEVVAEGQGGLMDIELHPKFIENNLVYFSYSIPYVEDGELASTAIGQAVLDGNTLINVKLIFEALPYSEMRHHYGCRMDFDNDGYLFFSVGDRGNRDENPQYLTNHLGKIHRINDDGTIPEDNPFYYMDKALASIYSYGHRNPQGLIKHPETGEIWTHEHGPRGGDEINIIRPGLNYGWPAISYGINYDGTTFTNMTDNLGMEQPLHYWVPSIAPCGMTFISGDKYPGWEGDLLVGSLRFEYLHRCDIEDGKVVHEEMLLKNIGRLRNVKQGPDGFVYVAVEEPGVIYKIVPIL